MEKLKTKFMPSCIKREQTVYRSPCKLNALNFEKTSERYLTLPNPVNNFQFEEIIKAVMKKNVLQYRSIFIQNKFFQDEQSNPKIDVPKQTCETQQIISQVEKKGYHFFQYSANNPIEDSICHFEIPELNAFVVSIFDGHGGPELSKFCAKNTQKYLQKYIKNGIKLHKYENNKIQLIKDGLVELHYQLENQFYKFYLKNIHGDNKKIKGVGTCAITIVLYDNKVIVANCGDSQSMVISQDRGSYNYQKLSERFSVSNKAERQRLIKQFKQIDQDIVVEERKNVYYLKGMLQPTKSIGDYYLKHKEHYLGQGEFKGPYLSCQPDIRVYDLKQHDKHIVVASDGLWDYLSKWQILKYVVQSQNDKKSIAQRETQSETQDQVESKPIISSKYLAEKILEKVSNDFDFDINYVKSLQLGERRSYHDDITIGIIDIDEFFHKETVKN